MAWLNELPGMGAAEDRAAKALSFPVGAASPLWLAFGAAASAGVAFWLATRWARPTNLEAMLEAPVKALKSAVEAIPDAPPVPQAAAERLVAAADPTPVVEIVLEAAEELETATTEAVAAALDAPVVDAPVEEAPVAAAPPVEAPVTEVAAEPAAAAVIPAAPDDLTRIAGIGPKLAAALAERGVTRFADLAAWGEAELAEVDKALSLKGRAVRDAWVAQAKRFADA
ncbi:helix-hairpin-helix domain-containing protein [Caulobacter sp. KR2-114]|uniref:helix-hairpin-helix domain-containing protein n=1 Tax=Caulobacter sp. KR2-114 TaxID=3400912 RepID=UPI003C0527C7